MMHLLIKYTKECIPLEMHLTINNLTRIQLQVKIKMSIKSTSWPTWTIPKNMDLAT